MKPANFPELDKLYTSKNRFVRNLFWGRILTALSFVDINDDSVILDVGCGSGHLLKSVRKVNSKCECWGTDVVESKIAETVNCKFQVADAKNLPFESKRFDIVFTLDILEHIKDNVELSVKEIARVLKPSGVVILSGPTESTFYKICRSILFYVTKKSGEYQEPLERQDIEAHFHNVYQLEDKFVGCGFMLSRQKSLPGFPFPPLFRVSKFQK